MTEATSDLLSAAQSLAPDVVALRRKIHADPELGLHLPRTQTRVVEALTGLGLNISLGEKLSSVVADLDTGRPGPTLLLRGDMDALPLTEDTGLAFASANPGVMHACGHDTHVAMLVGAAMLLSENKGELTGRVRFMFQPGEEGFHGARFMIEEGVLDGVDRAFAIHVDTNLPARLVSSRAGAACASSDEFVITVTGKGGHASAPHLAADPITAAAATVTSLHTMVSREVDVFEPAVVTVAHIEAGTTTNIIPETARMAGTIRAVSETARTKVHSAMPRVVAGAAAAHGCEAEIEIEVGYPVTVNDAAVVDQARSVAERTLGAGSFLTSLSPIMAAEDFSYVLQQVPGAIVGLGVCPAEIEDPHQADSLHSNKAVLNEDALPAGVALHAAMAMARP